MEEIEITEELKRKIKVMEEMANMRLEFGVVDEEKKTNGELVWQYAIYVEYGSKDGKKPARPFYASMIHTKRNYMNKLAIKLFTSVIDGKISKPITAYKRLGRYLKASLENSLLNGDWTPNAPITIKMKKSSQPLVDTKNLLHCLGFKIYNGDTLIYQEVGR